MKHMYKRFYKCFILLLVSCLFLTSCKSEEHIFYYYIEKMPQNLDPQVASTPEELSVVSGLFDGLFSMGADGKPVLQAAERYEVSADGLVYTIYLKKDLSYRYQVSFNDDDDHTPPPVTAHDYVFGIQRVFMPETQSPHTTKLSAIKNAQQVLNGASPSTLGIKAVDDYTLQITLSYPDPAFLEALTCAGAMPCNQAFFESTGGAYGLTKETLLCNGPYNLRTWNDYDGVTLVAIDETSSVPRIRLPILDEDISLQELITENETDAAILPHRLLTENATSYNVTEVNTTTWVLLFNPNTPGLNNQQIRSALANTAIYTSSQTSLPSDLSLANGLIPPSVSIGGTSYRDAVGSATTASSLPAAKTEYTNGLASENLTKLENIKVLTPDDNVYANLLETINQGWQSNLSAFFAIEKMSVADMITAVKRGDFDIAFIPVSALSNDIYALLLPYTTGGEWYWVGENNSAFTAALAPLANTQQGRQNLYFSAEKALLRDYVICPLFFESSSFLTSEWIKGLFISPFGPLIDFHSFKT